jgi:RNA polymerase sigma factor (sigma-70 family)
MAPEPIEFVVNANSDRAARTALAGAFVIGRPPTKPCAAVASDTASLTRSSESAADALSVFVDVRPRLFGIAYRILGSASAAEDVVQDAWLRWQAIDRSVVQNARAYLATTTTRLAINVAQSARSDRERYVGTWLPEPVDTRPSPQSEIERGEALRHAVLLLVETLSARERAAYVLREAFNYSYRQIGDALQLAETNARQLVARARKRVADRPRPPAGSGKGQRFLDAFIAAAQNGDRYALEKLFVSDIGRRRLHACRATPAPPRRTWVACDPS